MDDNIYDRTVEAGEEAIKNTSSKAYYSPDTFNYKMCNEFMLALAVSTKNAKEISVVYYLLRMMGKNNIAHNIRPKDVYTRADISKPVYYKLIGRLKESGLVVEIAKYTYMVNPEMVINHRKSVNKDRPQLLALWSEYRKQARLLGDK